MTQYQKPYKSVLAFPNLAITALHRQIKLQLGILAKAKAVLPTALASHALHCVVNEQKLIIYTDSANWASQLRFYPETLLTAIAPLVQNKVRSVQIKVIDTALTAPMQPIRQVRLPAPTVVAEIRQQSQLATDPTIKQALSKLSDTLTRLSADSQR